MSVSTKLTLGWSFKGGGGLRAGVDLETHAYPLCCDHAEADEISHHTIEAPACAGCSVSDSVPLVISGRRVACLLR